MNKLLNSLSVCLAIVVAMSSILSSCDKAETPDRRVDLLALVPDDATLTLAFSPEAVFRSAGIEATSDGLTLSKPIEKLISNNSRLEEAVRFIAGARGIDYKCAVVAGGTDDGCALFALNSASKFCAWAKDNGMNVETEGEYAVCFTDVQSPAVVVDGFVAWFFGSADKDKALPMVEKCKAQATDKKLADWKLPLLTKGDVDLMINTEKYVKQLADFGPAVFPADVAELQSELPNEKVYCSAITLNFDGPTVRFSGEVYDSIGNITPVLAKDSYTPLAKGSINLVKDSQCALAFSLPDAYKNIFKSFVSNYDWDNIALEEAENTRTLIGSIRDIAFGIMVDESFSLFNPSPADVTATLALNLDKPEFTKAVSALIASAPMPQLAEIVKAWADNTSTTIQPNPAMPDFNLTFCGSGDYAIVSTDESKAQTVINPSEQTDLIAYVKADIPKGHILLSFISCPFGIKAEATTTDTKTEGFVTLTDSDSPILEALIKLAIRF